MQTNGMALADFLVGVEGLSREQFLKRHRSPVLLVETLGEEEESSLENFATQRLVDSHTSMQRQVNIEDLVAHLKDAAPKVAVLSVEKKDSKFKSIITLGRAPKSDLMINVSSVSKFHCYFTHKAVDNSWFLSDAAAANGTYLNGQKLEANTKVRLEDGSAVRFGYQVRGRFFMPEAFFDYLSTLRHALGS